MSAKSTKTIKRIGLAAAGVIAIGGVVLGTASLASAEPNTPSPSASASQADGHGDGRGGGRGHGGASSDTAVTGDELAKVTAAMKAKDAAVAVTGVRKDPDGSYDVLGTKDGAEIMYDVSADLTTFTQNSDKAEHKAEH